MRMQANAYVRSMLIAIRMLDTDCPEDLVHLFILVGGVSESLNSYCY